MLQWSETTGCGATIKLDNGDVVHVSIALSRVTIRQWDLSGLLKTLASNFFGPKLYKVGNAGRNARAAESLRLMYPMNAPGLPPFQNPVLAAFTNAICQCGSAAEVRAVLNEAASRARA
jgi:hypothetical protein